MSLVSELIQTPVADLDEVVVDFNELTNSDAQDVADQLSAVVTKLHAALRMGLVHAAMLLMQLIDIAVTRCTDDVVSVLRASVDRQRATDHNSSDLLSSLVDLLDLLGSSSLHEALLQLLNVLYLLGGTSLKDLVGDRLILRLLTFLEPQASFSENATVSNDAAHVMRCTSLQRQAASVLIQLLRQSKANKVLLFQHLVVIPKCMHASTDYFLQLQCAEILFRLYVHDKQALMNSTAKQWIGKRVFDGLAKVKNDAALLLKCLEDILCAINSDRADMLSVDAVRMEGGGGATSASTSSFTICGPTTLHFNACFVMFLLPEEVGVHITIPYADVGSMRLTKDHKITLRLQRVPAVLEERWKPAGNVITSTDGAGAILTIHLTSTGLKAVLDSKVRDWMTSARHQATSSSGAVASASSRGVTASVAESNPPRAGRAPSTVVTNSPQSSRAKRSRSQGGGRNAASAAASEPQQPPASGQWMEGGQMLNRVEDELRHAITSRVQEREARKEEVMSNLVMAMQALVNQTRSETHRDLDDYEVWFRRQCEALAGMASELKKSAMATVDNLNEGLADLGSMSDAIHVELDQLSSSGPAVAEELKASERKMLDAIKAEVDGDLIHMHEALTDFITNNGTFIEKVAAVKGGGGGGGSATKRSKT